ncbi:hypothetical protein CEXT_429371 [Caerostris extrusa]|uniref:DUF5641 domain-containing protein n=1 Tax=Caerostris extrusa TaxID=172846 RepID=A0AAV4SW08_CAEEX|nr:hypothetical protein CEXT_429371 [Caerostris extrusa]
MWLRDKPNLNINDLVLIKEENLPPLMWRIGRIIELYSGIGGKRKKEEEEEQDGKKFPYIFVFVIHERKKFYIA